MTTVNGVDAKLLVFEENAKTFSTKNIDLTSLIESHLFSYDKSSLLSNCILINIPGDIQRYENSLKEFEKISFRNFHHLKATYWKEKTKFIEDLNYVLNFLSDYNPLIVKESLPLKMNEFSEVNDTRIEIQDGPLACYVSHVRSMIYGYLNFKDYTIICEDDFVITNSEKIEVYLPVIPGDWDIIYMNSAPKNVSYNEAPFYKFVDEFHSGHFAIIRNNILPKIFANIYPITDQIDVLISNMRDQVNIYNIVDTVYQRNLSTNTQNNLNAIFKSPNYHVVRDHIRIVNELLDSFINKELPQNEPNNQILRENIIFDVIFSSITRLQKNSTDNSFENFEDEIKDDDLLTNLWKSIDFILKCTCKAVNTNTVALAMLNVIISTIRKFKKLHNKNISGYFVLKAQGYGATSNTYIDTGKLIAYKAYNYDLRWETKGHSDSVEIFERELKILDEIKGENVSCKILARDKAKRILKMTYAGQSLYDKFHLPKDWKEQIMEIFETLTKHGIVYPEFNIRNILVKDDRLYFVDFGLARFGDEGNEENCTNFIDMLEILERRLNNEADRTNVLILYDTFVNNMRIEGKFDGNIF